jgi:hypothetical protein
MKLKCNLLSMMWQHDFLMKQIFFSLIFLSENKGRLAKLAGYPGHTHGRIGGHGKVCLTFFVFAPLFWEKLLFT